MTHVLAGWSGCPAPAPVVLEGRYARLEPLGPQHAVDLFATSSGPGAGELFRYLPEHPPESLDDVAQWIAVTTARTDLLMWAVVDRSTGRAGGRQALMRIDAPNGVIELGSILWGLDVSRTRVATEAFALHAGHVFDELGYRRLEWKCNAANAPSRRAAERFGFAYEGTFAQHMVVKGANRDTAWFALLDRQWPEVRARLDRWLRPENFGSDGTQRSRLGDGAE